MEIRKLIYEREIFDEINNEINILKGAIKNINIFLMILISEKNKSFGNIKKTLSNLDQLHGEILKFVNNNSSKLKDNIKTNLYLDYFLDLIKYYNKKNEIGSLFFFNLSKIDEINNYSKEKKEFYNEINHSDFFNLLTTQIETFINEIIEELEDEISGQNVLEGVILYTKDEVEDIKGLENKRLHYKNDLKNIISDLYKNKNENIGFILNHNKNLERVENIILFLETFLENTKNTELENILNILYSIQDNSLKFTFEEYLEENKINLNYVLRISNIFEENLK